MFLWIGVPVPAPDFSPIRIFHSDHGNQGKVHFVEERVCILSPGNTTLPSSFMPEIPGSFWVTEPFFKSCTFLNNYVKHLLF